MKANAQVSLLTYIYDPLDHDVSLLTIGSR